MPASFSNNTTRTAFINFIAARYTTNAQQRSLVINAFYGNDALIVKISLDKAPHDFASHLVEVCEQFGDLNDGTPALVELKNTLKRSVGIDKQAELDSYFATAPTVPQSPPPTPTPQDSTPMSIPTTTTPKKVFISYKMDDDAWNETVWRFVAALKRDGFTVSVAIPTLDLDGLTIAEWSDREVRNADVVLVCTSPKYKDVFDRNQAPNTGLGVAVEVAAMRRELYQSTQVNKKYIPVLLPDITDASIPAILVGYPYVTYPLGYELLKQSLMGIRYGVEFEEGSTPVYTPPRRITPDPPKP